MLRALGRKSVGLLVFSNWHLMAIRAVFADTAVIFSEKELARDLGHLGPGRLIGLRCLLMLVSAAFSILAIARLKERAHFAVLLTCSHLLVDHLLHHREHRLKLILLLLRKASKALFEIRLLLELGASD